MAAPRSADARRFHACARARLAEARHLADGGYGTAAVYLGGYSVECALKALLLEATPRAGRAGVLASFRGVKAHDFGWLLLQYRGAGGPGPPRDVLRLLTVVEDWSPALRYSVAKTPAEDVSDFLAAADDIFHWADRRL